MLFMMFAAYGHLAAQQTLAMADSAYNAGKYEEAVGMYEAIVRLQGVSAASLYNLGNAYVQSGDYGRAMLCYERARRLDPSDGRIRNNLMWLESRVADNNKADVGGKKRDVGYDTPTFFESAHHRMTRDVSSDTWARFGVLAFLLTLAAVALYVFAQVVTVRKVGFFGAMVFLAFTIAFVTLSFMSAKEFHRQDEGVLVAYKTVLLKEPDQGSGTVSTPLNRGTRLRVLDEDIDASGKPSWYRVRLNSSTSGWVAADDFEII